MAARKGHPCFSHLPSIGLDAQPSWFSIFLFRTAWSRVDWWTGVYRCSLWFRSLVRRYLGCWLHKLPAHRWRTPQWFRMLNRHVSAWLVWNCSVLDLMNQACRRPVCHSKEFLNQWRRSASLHKRFIETVLDIHYRCGQRFTQTCCALFQDDNNAGSLWLRLRNCFCQELVFVEGKVSSLTYADLQTYQF